MNFNKYITPFDATNSTNPYLLNKHMNELIVGPEGIPLSAEYIWSKQGKDRDDLVEWVFHYFRKNGFPFPKETDDRLKKDFAAICKNSTDDIVNEKGEVKNSSSSGSNIIKHFCGELFYGVAGQGKMISCIEAFNNDDYLRFVIRNRMGYRESGEDGVRRPYIFAMSHSMLIQGFRSSAIGFATSQFKPMVGKYIYEKYADGNKVLDYSAGWSSRLISAGSLGLQYTGIDPLTYDCCNKAAKFFDLNANVIQGGSEDKKIYEGLTDYDLAFSSPPYFTLERYSTDTTQSYNKFDDYKNWLENYWKPTVENCYGALRHGGKFIVCVAEKYNKFELAKDMTGICEGMMKEVETVKIKTSQSHLSGKKESKNISKNTEAFYVFEK